MGNSCSNSSNLYGNVNITTVSSGEGGAGGARLVMNIPLSGISGGLDGDAGDAIGTGDYTTTGSGAYLFQISGVTAGDVLRYDAIPYDVSSHRTGGKYVKANANSAGTSEVVGVVESIDVVDRFANIVIYGQIKYPPHRLYNAEHVDAAAGATGSGGGNDVYFLSGTTAGYLQNLAPSTPTYVAKPVLQMAEDPNAEGFNAIVANYIGYQIGGEIVASEDNEDDGTMSSVISDFGPDELTNPCIQKLDGRWLPIDNTFSLKYYSSAGHTWHNAYTNLKNKNSLHGLIYAITLTTKPTNRDTKTNKAVKQLNSVGVQSWTGNVLFKDTSDPSTVYVSSNNENVPTTSTQLYFSGVGYNIKEAKIVGMYLPIVNSLDRVSVKNVLSGKETRQHKTEYLTLCPDASTRRVLSVPNEVEVSKLVVRDSIQLENATTSIADPVKVIDDLVTKVNELTTNFNGVGASQVTGTTPK